MKYALILFAFVFSTLTSAQEEWVGFNIEEETKQLYPKDVIPVVNEDTNQIAMFFTNRKVIFGNLHDQNKQLIGSINNVIIPKKGKILIGAIYDQETYTLFFSNNNKSHFSSVSLSFKTGNFKITEDLNIEFKKEKIVEYLVLKNKLHILSVSRKEDVLISRTLTDKGLIKTTHYDLSSQAIVNNIDRDYPLYPLLFGNPNYAAIEVVNSNVPNSLEQTNAFTKLYVDNNKLTITNNLFNKYTYVISLDLESDSYNFNSIINTGYTNNHHGANSNSFIHKDKLLTIYSTLDHLSFSAYNLDDFGLIKTFNINDKEEITFKNTPIIQEGGAFDDYRELEKTSKFLRKITQSKIGITAYSKNEDLIITLGASVEIDRGGFAMVNFGAFGVIAYGLILDSFNSYTRTKSTRISCLFDKDLNHKTGDIPLNEFDQIKNFQDANRTYNNAHLQTLFKYQSSYFLGNYNKRTGEYTLTKFDN
ncbi:MULTISPECIES: hypothetical protein [unclassified Olleya]|jgi:hypothetical protein|uniref:hypothetical protein n=1 Tax=unclassified Olleya TaxID=2615019 RepID=UPI0011A4A5B5|nr:hypothetical protein [Olleya sp. Hel_I_94]TVZ48380.1 hypothetical protein JM82_3020 [Olleya sp. Hel_I_94]